MSRGWVRLVTAFTFVTATASNALAQGSSTASISGVVVDSRRRRHSRRRRRRQEHQDRRDVHDGVVRPRRVLGAGADHRHLHRVGVARRDSRPSSSTTWSSTPACRPTCARRWRSAGSPRQVMVQANSELVQTADGDGGDDARHATGRQPAARRAATPPTSSCSCRACTTPGATRDSIVNGLPQSTINMTLDGVNIQDNTLKSTDGFFAIVGPRIDAIEEITVFDGGRRRREPGRRRDADPLHDASRAPTSSVGGVFHQYRSDALNANTLVQQAGRAAEAGAAAEPAGIQHRRPDHAPGLRRPQPRVLLRQLRGAAAAVGHAAQPPDSPSRCRAGHLPLQRRRRRRRDGEPVRARRAQRSARDARSDRVEAARRHPQRRSRPKAASAISPIRCSSSTRSQRSDGGDEPLSDSAARLPDRAVVTA